MSGDPKVHASSEEAIIDARRAKGALVRERGDRPFANDVEPQLGGRTLDVAAARAIAAPAMDANGRYDEAKVKAAAGDALVHVRGRVIAFRSTGGLSFLRLRDSTGELQLLVSEEALGAAYGRLGELDVGDVVEAEGPLTASKRGELSIAPRRVRLLTKAFRPLPEKWHGLTDVEIALPPAVRRPRSRTRRWQSVFRARTHIVRAPRAILDEHGFLEVETPTMHSLIGGAAAKPFATHHNALDMRLFMRIAPELYLKRLVVGGLERVYEIGRCYRNEGISTRHNPEFTMLEFYQAYATYEDLMDFTEVLLRGIDARLVRGDARAARRVAEARPFALDEPFARVPMDRAVAVAAERTAIPEWSRPWRPAAARRS